MHIQDIVRQVLLESIEETYPTLCNGWTKGDGARFPVCDPVEVTDDMWNDLYELIKVCINCATDAYNKTLKLPTDANPNPKVNAEDMVRYIASKISYFNRQLIKSDNHKNKTTGEGFTTKQLPREFGWVLTDLYKLKGMTLAKLCEVIKNNRYTYGNIRTVVKSMNKENSTRNKQSNDARTLDIICYENEEPFNAVIYQHQDYVCKLNEEGKPLIIGSYHLPEKLQDIEPLVTDIGKVNPFDEDTLKVLIDADGNKSIVSKAAKARRHGYYPNTFITNESEFYSVITSLQNYLAGGQSRDEYEEKAKEKEDAYLDAMGMYYKANNITGDDTPDMMKNQLDQARRRLLQRKLNINGHAGEEQKNQQNQRNITNAINGNIFHQNIIPIFGNIESPCLDCITKKNKKFYTPIYITFLNNNTAYEKTYLWKNNDKPVYFQYLSRLVESDKPINLNNIKQENGKGENVLLYTDTRKNKNKTQSFSIIPLIPMGEGLVLSGSDNSDGQSITVEADGKISVQNDSGMQTASVSEHISRTIREVLNEMFHRK